MWSFDPDLIKPAEYAGEAEFNLGGWTYSAPFETINRLLDLDREGYFIVKAGNRKLNKTYKKVSFFSCEVKDKFRGDVVLYAIKKSHLDSIWSRM